MCFIWCPKYTPFFLLSVNPPVKAMQALEKKDAAVLPNPHKGTADPTHGL